MPTSKRKIWVDLMLYPGHTLPTAAAPVIVAAGLALHDHVFAALPLLLGFLASWLIHVGGVFTDHYLLLARHGDVREHPELNDALADGTLKLSALRAAIILCMVLALLPGPYLLHVAGWPVAVIGGIGMAASLSYAAGPLTLARRGLADPVFIAMFGVFAVAAAYYVQAAARAGGAAAALTVLGALPESAYLVGLPVGTLVTSVLVIDDIRDREFDEAKGWRTGAVRFGRGWSRAEVCILTGFAYLAPLWFWLGLGYRWWVLLPLATAPHAIGILRTVATAQPREALEPMTPKQAALGLVYSILLAIGLALS